MMGNPNGISPERTARTEKIMQAASDAVREALRRHMLLGESVAVAGENGGVKILGPDEIREALTDW